MSTTEEQNYLCVVAVPQQMCRQNLLLELVRLHDLTRENYGNHKNFLKKRETLEESLSVH